MKPIPAADSPRKVVLRDGTPGIVRPIIPSDRESLQNAFEELAEETKQRRFFYTKSSLSERELERLSQPDGINHLAFGLAVKIPDEAEMQPIAVARCFRDPADETLAEIAIITADLWQNLGAGAELMRTLSAAAWEVGIRRWFAAMFSDNFAMEKLLQRHGRKCEQRKINGGIVEVIYEINEPTNAFHRQTP